MKYILTILLAFTCWISNAQQCRNTDSYFVKVGTSLFDWNAVHSIGFGKYISGTYSAFSLEYRFMRENYTIIPISYAGTHTIELLYSYSFRFCGPLYLNPGISIFAGKEKARVNSQFQKVFSTGGRFFAQMEVRCGTIASIFLEPGITYRFKTILKDPLDIGITGGLKISF